jgi:hypothetical protein
MRALFVFMLAGSLIFAQSDSEKIRIEGRVVSATGEPVRKATVRLAAFTGEATNVKLEPSGNVSSNVKVISREKAAAEVAKLP